MLLSLSVKELKRLDKLAILDIMFAFVCHGITLF